MGNFIEKEVDAIKACDHVFIRMSSSDGIIKFKCLKNCGCDNTFENAAFQQIFLENLPRYLEILEEESKGKGVFMESLQNIAMELNRREIKYNERLLIEFEIKNDLDIVWRALNRLYTELFGLDQNMIDCDLPLSLVLRVFENLSKGNMSTNEAIDNINELKRNK